MCEMCETIAVCVVVACHYGCVTVVSLSNLLVATVRPHYSNHICPTVSGLTNATVGLVVTNTK